MASSTSRGVRPSRSRMRSYSSSVRPSWRCRASSEYVLLDMRSYRLEDRQAIDRSAQGIDRVLGVGHEAEHVSGLVADAGDVAQRSVRVVPRAIPEHHLAGRLEAVELGFGRVVAAGGVLDRD